MRTIAAPENFFKHADRDPGDSIEFNPETSEYFIFASLAELQVLSGTLPKEGLVFQMWFLFSHDGMLLENESTRPIREALDRVRRVGRVDKWDFLAMIR